MSSKNRPSKAIKKATSVSKSSPTTRSQPKGILGGVMKAATNVAQKIAPGAVRGSPLGNLARGSRTFSKKKTVRKIIRRALEKQAVNLARRGQTKRAIRIYNRRKFI